jgi:hypothetical protein
MLPVDSLDPMRISGLIGVYEHDPIGVAVVRNIERGVPDAGYTEITRIRVGHFVRAGGDKRFDGGQAVLLYVIADHGNVYAYPAAKNLTGE